MKKTFHIDTYGCQMNVADSELVESILLDHGYEKSNSIDVADAIFVNTCAIRDHAEEKVHSQLGRYDQIKKENGWRDRYLYKRINVRHYLPVVV